MDSNPIQRVTDELARLGCGPKRSGRGWTALCPAHDDADPSLTVSEGDDGRVLLRCHAGCSFDAIVGALGMRASEMFSGSGTANAPGSMPTGSRARAVATPETPRRMFPDMKAAIHGREEEMGEEACHRAVYQDRDGEPVGCILRWDQLRGRKRILPVSREPGSSKWSFAGMPAPRPLYRLPALLSADPDTTAYVVEGEKCADAATACDLLATTSSHGAHSPRKTDWTPLRGRDVVILPDADQGGETYAGTVSDLLNGAGARSVQVARLSSVWPGIPKGGDIVDYIEHCGGEIAEVVAGIGRATECPACESDLEEESDETDGKDASDGSDATDARDGEDGTRRGFLASADQPVSDLLRRCIEAYESMAESGHGPDQLRPVFRVARVLCRSAADDGDNLSTVGTMLAQRFPDDWPYGPDEAVLAVKQAVARYDPDKDTLVSAVARAREILADSPPACLEAVKTPTGRIVFLSGVCLARDNGGPDFHVSQSRLAEAIGRVSQQMVGRALKHELEPAGVLKQTYRGHPGRASEYRLFAIPEDILNGAEPIISTPTQD